MNGAPPYAPQSHTWQTIDEREVRRIIGKFVPTKRRLNTDPVAPWVDALSKIRLGLSDPASVEEDSDGDLEGLETVYRNYCAELDNARVLDFDGQIDRAIRVLLGDASARQSAQLANRVLLVDEFRSNTCSPASHSAYSAPETTSSVLAMMTKQFTDIPAPTPVG